MTMSTITRDCVLALATLMLALAAVLAFAPDAFLPMLARAFARWWALGFVLLAAWAAWCRARWLALAGVTAAALALPRTSMPALALVNDAGLPDVRVAHLDVFQPNMRHAEAVRSILDSDADLVSVQEVVPESAEALCAALRERYPHQVVVPRTNCYGIALFSRKPLLRAGPIEVAGSAFIEADVEVDGRPVRAYAVHASSPGAYGDFRRRNAQLAELARRVRRCGLPVLLIGDLNTVHWDDAYGGRCAVSGLRPINPSHLATWPSIGPLAFIPLDHALVAGGLRPASVRTFRIAGSDHRGLLTELLLPHVS